MKKNKAYILGVLCGDGSLFKYKERGYQRFCWGLSSIDKEFLEYFINQIELAFGIRYKLIEYDRNTKNLAGKDVVKHYYSVFCRKKEMYNELLSYSKTFRTKEWGVPLVIMKQNKKVKGMFLKGLFDSDGCIVFEWKERKYRYPSIRFDSTNKEGIIQVKNLLEDLGIGCYISGSWKKPCV